jgi:TonB family protein
MQQTGSGRYCSQCSHVVTDFTDKTEQEIRAYLQLVGDKRICGRFQKHQIEPPPVGPPYRNYDHSTQPLWLFAVALILAFGASLFTLNRYPQTVPHTVLAKSQDPEPESTRMLGIVMYTRDLIPKGTMVGITNPILLTDSARKNQVGPVDGSVSEVFNEFDDAPLFPGGDLGLLAFLKARIHYPKEEWNIGGEVLVNARFTVDTLGHVQDVSIVKSGGPAFDLETMRVIRLMQYQTPGKINGRHVAVRVYLPIRFTLKN